jgi:hypothetical protein
MKDVSGQVKEGSIPAESAVAEGQHGPHLTRDTVSRNWHNLDNRLSLIAEAAYFKAQKRGFEVGHEEADWLEAEQELAEIMGEN